MTMAEEKSKEHLDKAPQPIRAGETAAFGRRLVGKDEWVRCDSSGTASLVQVDKQALVQRLWIPFRDLGQVDPNAPIPYPSSIFIRERALVINLESVRMIITKDEVFVTSIPVPGSPGDWQRPTLTSKFIRDLCQRLACHSPKPYDAGCITTPGSPAAKDIPFELRGVEAALASSVTVLELAVRNLESLAFPALDSLLLNLSRTELNNTRHVKSLTTHLTSRVKRIRSELEKTLNDDQDMADMYLGRREELETADHHHGDLDEEADRALDRHKGPKELRTAHPHDIEDCENLLENYFMQMDFLMSRLEHLKERTDDTEDLINIELDQRRNELVSLDLVLTALATAFGFVACVGGIFGMNLSPLPIQSTEAGFWAATFGAIFCGSLMIIAFLGYAYWKKILLIPS